MCPPLTGIIWCVSACVCVYLVSVVWDIFMHGTHLLLSSAVLLLLLIDFYK